MDILDSIQNSKDLETHQGKIIVIKYGGNAMGGGDENSNALEHFARDIAILIQHGVKPVIVHGGGPQIDAQLKRLGIQSEFVRGLRITTAEAIGVIEMVLSGSVNPEIVTALELAGVMAVGISGKDGNLIMADKLKSDDADYGFVGNITQVNSDVLVRMIDAGITPVIAPIGIGTDGQSYNINADTAAGAIAGALRAHRFFLLTNVTNVLDADKNPMTELTAATAEQMIADGIIAGGMIPKVETCLAAIHAGAGTAVILDGRVPHNVLIDLYTDTGAGTLVRQ
jgi:acetylglutamate kinase